MTLWRDLLPHPCTTGGPVAAIRADLQRRGRLLSVTWAVGGDIDAVRLPQRGQQERTDGLWRHTCFEIFLQRPGEEGYLEFNLSPSGQWAAYQFEAYRSGGRDLEIPPPSLGGTRAPDLLQLFISLAGLPSQRWNIGLSAVIEDTEGQISYWALAHPSDRPDFHHPKSFALEFPGPTT